MREKLLYLLLLLIALLVASCGKKGEPTLRTFEKPPAVRDIKAVHREDQLIISWSYPAPEREAIKGFYIEKAEAGENKPFKNLVFLKSDVSQFVDRDFKTGGKYLYKMRVYSLRNVLSDESMVIQVNPAELPSPPAGLSYKITEDSTEIRWDRVSDAARYNIYRSSVKGKYPVSPLNKVPLKETLFKDGVETEKISYYTARALLDTALEDEGYPSDELEVNPETFVPSRPSHIKYVPSEKKTYLMWDESPETWVKGYRVYKKSGSDSGFRLIGEAATPAFTDSGPLVSKTLYCITAVGPKKESAPSETLEVYPLKN